MYRMCSYKLNRKSMQMFEGMHQHYNSSLNTTFRLLSIQLSYLKHVTRIDHDSTLGFPLQCCMVNVLYISPAKQQRQKIGEEPSSKQECGLSNGPTDRTSTVPY